MKRVFTWILVCTILLGIANIAGPTLADPPGAVPGQTNHANLLNKAQQNGTIRVLVGLNVPTKLEATMQAQAVAAQRAAIQQTQNLVINGLGRGNAQVIRSFKIIPVMALEVNENALRGLLNSPYVAYVYEDIPVEPNLASSLPVIGADLTQSNGFTGAGQTVAILDTGTDNNHPFLAGRIVEEACFSTFATSLCPNGEDSQIGPGSANAMTAACIDSDGNPFCRHGSHVAGIAAGNDDDNGDTVAFYGVAPDADIISIQVFSKLCDFSSCLFTWATDYIAAMEYVYALHNDYNIASVNMSLGGGQYFDEATCDAVNAPIKAIVDQLKAVGIATIASAGNSSFTTSMGRPACVSSIISVGASTDADVTADFSNVATFLDLYAPGVNIDSSVPDDTYDEFNGTSMAAPHITGAFAVLRQVAPNATVDDILNALKATGVLITDTRSGAPGDISIPRIQLDAALAELNDPPTANAGGPYVVNENSSVLLNGSATDPNQDANTLALAWDFDADGQFDDATGPTPTFSAAGMNGPDTVQVGLQVTDYGGLTSTVYADINISNVAPTIILVINTGPISEGSGAAIVVIATDPIDSLMYEFDCDNDGNYDYRPSSYDNAVCIFTDDGIFTVTVRVGDDADTTTDTTAVTVNNVAPTASFTGPAYELYQGESATLNFSNAYDPSLDDISAGFTYAVDCTDDDSVDFTATLIASEYDFACPYPDAGTFTARGTITDKDGDSSSYTANITVISTTDAIQIIIDAVEALHDAGSLNNGQANALLVKLDKVIKQLSQAHPQAAVNTLTDFIFQVIDLVEEGVLMPEEGQELVGLAVRVLNTIN